MCCEAYTWWSTITWTWWTFSSFNNQHIYCPKTLDDVKKWHNLHNLYMYSRQLALQQFDSVGSFNVWFIGNRWCCLLSLTVTTYDKSSAHVFVSFSSILFVTVFIVCLNQQWKCPFFNVSFAFILPLSLSLSLQQMERILNKASKTHKHRVEVTCRILESNIPSNLLIQTCKTAQSFK